MMNLPHEDVQMWKNAIFQADYRLTQIEKNYHTAIQKYPQLPHAVHNTIFTAAIQTRSARHTNVVQHKALLTLKKTTLDLSR
jgi:hypothetical protein